VKRPGGNDGAAGGGGGGGNADASLTSGVVCVAWHPTRASCAASVGRRVFLIDGVSSAVLTSLRLPHASLALAYSPAVLGARLVVLLCDGSLHDVDVESTSHGTLRALHPPTGGEGVDGGWGGVWQKEKRVKCACCWFVVVLLCPINHSAGPPPGNKNT
jgi:hypothetical protein